LRSILFVGLGGFAGSIARFYVSKLNTMPGVAALPLGTFLVNVTGSLILGFLTGIADRSDLLTLEWRLFLMVGFCGGFTTFSTFTHENLTYLRNGQIGMLLMYAGLSVLTGFIAIYLGYVSSKLFS
jgi:CrcB protein